MGTYIKLTVMLSGISVLFYMIMMIQSNIRYVYKSLPLHISATQHITTHSLGVSAFLPIDFLDQLRKSKHYYLSAVDKLSFKRITPSSILLEQPYFTPNPNNRFVIVDEELISPSGCTDKTRIVVLILSEPNSVASRKTIRQTWGSVASGKLWPETNFKMDIQLLFVVGVHHSNDTGEPMDNSQLQSEAGSHNDILQLSTIDSYSNLTRKVILGFKWINERCPKISYVIKADQDIFVNLPLMWQFFLKNGEENAIYGHVYFTGPVKRKGRWAVPTSVLPIEKFPAYASGTSYVISSDAIGKVLHTYYLFPYVRIEDAFITGIVASVAKIDRYKVKGFAQWSDSTPDSCELVMDRIYTANGVDVDKMANMWRDIEVGGNGRCI